MHLLESWRERGTEQLSGGGSPRDFDPRRSPGSIKSMHSVAPTNLFARAKPDRHRSSTILRPRYRETLHLLAASTTLCIDFGRLAFPVAPSGARIPISPPSPYLLPNHGPPSIHRIRLGLNSQFLGWTSTALRSQPSLYSWVTRPYLAFRSVSANEAHGALTKY